MREPSRDLLAGEVVGKSAISRATDECSCLCSRFLGEDLSLENKLRQFDSLSRRYFFSKVMEEFRSDDRLLKPLPDIVLRR